MRHVKRARKTLLAQGTAKAGARAWSRYTAGASQWRCTRKELDQGGEGVEIKLGFAGPYNNFEFHSQSDGKLLEVLKTLGDR